MPERARNCNPTGRHIASPWRWATSLETPPYSTRRHTRPAHPQQISPVAGDLLSGKASRLKRQHAPSSRMAATSSPLRRQRKRNLIEGERIGRGVICLARQRIKDWRRKQPRTREDRQVRPPWAVTSQSSDKKGGRRVATAALSLGRKRPRRAYAAGHAAPQQYRR